MLMPRPPEGATEQERAQHPHWRRFTGKYRRKQRIVRDIWLSAGVLMLLSPLAALPVWLLGTTLLSFVVLDETQ